MSKSRHVKYIKEPTSGYHNNCAYHAFILGLFDEDVLKKIEANLEKEGSTPDSAFEEFIKHAASALGVANTWAAVRERGLKLRHEDSLALQKALADPMRILAVELLTEETKKEYELQEKYRQDESYKKYKEEKKKKLDLPHKENPFTPELERQLIRAFEYPDSFDDIFRRHSFIVKKFKELRRDALSSIKEKKQRLKKWWRMENGGAKQFHDEMKKPGQLSGNYELKTLAKYFRTNLDIFGPGHSSDHPSRPYVTHGTFSLPHLTYVQAKELAGRGIVCALEKEEKFKLDNSLMWESITEAELVANLSAMSIESGYEQVKDYLSNHKPKNASAIPVAWKSNQTCLRTLELRGVVSREKFNIDCSKPDGLADMLLRIDEVPGKDAIIAEWRRSYLDDVPTITVMNPSAAHWSNVIVVSYESEDELKAILKAKKTVNEKAKEEAKKIAAEKEAAEKAAKKAAAEKEAVAKEVKKAAEKAAEKAAKKAAVEKEAVAKEVKKAAKKAAVVATETAKIAAKEFFTNTLMYLKTDEAKPDESKWKAIIEKATTEASDVAITKEVDYALANAMKLINPASKEAVAETVIVTREIQKQLDAELAKSLQQQEYAVYKGKKR